MEAKKSKYSFTWSASSYIPAWLVERLKRLGRRTTLSQQLQDYNMVHLDKISFLCSVPGTKEEAPLVVLDSSDGFREDLSLLCSFVWKGKGILSIIEANQQNANWSTPTCSKRLWRGRVQDTRARCWSPRPGRLCAPRRGRWWPHSPRWSTSRWSRRQTAEGLMLIINHHFLTPRV